MDFFHRPLAELRQEYWMIQVIKLCIYVHAKGHYNVRILETRLRRVRQGLLDPAPRDARVLRRQAPEVGDAGHAADGAEGGRRAQAARIRTPEPHRPLHRLL